jgi:hippurate hydrolase
VVAGIPTELKPTVVVREPYTRSTVNTPDFSRETLAFFKSRFGEARAREVPANMGGEDFGEFSRVDPGKIKSVIFWVGGTPEAKLASTDMANIPGTHSPFFAPEADKVIGTASEALIAATLRLMPK